MGCYCGIRNVGGEGEDWIGDIGIKMGSIVLQQGVLNSRKGMPWRDTCCIRIERGLKYYIIILIVNMYKKACQRH